MEARIIKTDEQYRGYLAEVEKLASSDPEPESKEGVRLELFAKLVEEYEKETFPFSKPDPVSAILFRMEQQGLRQKDVATYLGGKSRASEVLARKRPLTISMIRSLHEELAIPLDLLVGEISQEDGEGDEIPKKSIDLLVSRGWIPSIDSAREFIARLLAPAGSPVYLKQTLIARATERTNRTHVWLWLSRVREIAASRSYLKGRFKKSELNEDMIRYLVRLSWMEKGPRLAIEFLEEKGIAVVIEPHLPGTHLDGAAMLGRDGVPVIGLTLREDRLDNFWFTLVHECVHAWKHLDANNQRAIADENIESGDTDQSDIENEANSWAGEILLPTSKLHRSDAHFNPSQETIAALAEELQISPAIVAGRLRYQRRDYTRFTKLVGYRRVRVQFPEVRWS